MSRALRNPFETKEAAARFRNGRPFHHFRALQKILDVVGDGDIERALDVACGTGLSTIALADHARLAVGVDPAVTMLQLAAPATNAAYVAAAAEQLPFAANTFDALTVSSGVHWFEQPAFFAEAARVLIPGAWMGIYDHYFVGPLNEPSLESWLGDSYVRRYPSPPRGRKANKGLDAPREFSEVGAFEYDDPIEFTHDEFLSYLLSQSNTLMATTTEKETEQETATWLRAETARWFDPPAARTFIFRGTARCLRLAV